MNRPVELFRGNYVSATPIRSYEVTGDGRFILMRSMNPEVWNAQFHEFFPNRIRIDQGWLEKVSQLVPSGR